MKTLAALIKRSFWGIGCLWALAWSILWLVLALFAWSYAWFARFFFWSVSLAPRNANDANRVLNWLAFLAPYIAICLAVWIISEFDHFYFDEFLPQSVADGFSWASISQDPVARTREVTARFFLQMIAFLYIVASAYAVLWCLNRIVGLLSRDGLLSRNGLLTAEGLGSSSGWRSASLWIRLLLLLGVGVGTGFCIYQIWAGPGQALERTLWSELIEKAGTVTDRSDIRWVQLLIQRATCALVLPLLAITASFIVAQTTTRPDAIESQLDDLTAVLYLMAGTQFLFDFMQGTTLIWVAALLPQEANGQAAWCRHLGLALSLNFAIMSTLMIACFHVPCVWFVAKRHIVEKKRSLLEYYKKYWQILLVLFPLLAPVLTKLTSLLFAG